MEPQQKEITRALTPGEVNLARSAFGNTIFYLSVVYLFLGCRISTRR